MLCLLAANSSFQGLKKGNTDSTVVSVYGVCLQMNSSKYQNTAITPFQPCSLLSTCSSLDLARMTEQCEYGTSQTTSLSLFEITITGNGSDGMHAASGSAGKIAYIWSVWSILECREPVGISISSGTERVSSPILPIRSSIFGIQKLANYFQYSVSITVKFTL